MAVKLTSQKFDAMVQMMERMADGIAQHKGEEGFPKSLDDANRRAMRLALENARQRYETLAKEAQKAYDDFDDAFKGCAERLAKDDESVRGFYGKTKPVVADFGTKVIVTTRKKKAKPAPPKA